MSPEVTVIGCDGRPFGPEATVALAQAQLVVGAPRHLDAGPTPAIQENAEPYAISQKADRSLCIASGIAGGRQRALPAECRKRTW